jgi:hypothetical protein
MAKYLSQSPQTLVNGEHVWELLLGRKILPPER